MCGHRTLSLIQYCAVVQKIGGLYLLDTEKLHSNWKDGKIRRAQSPWPHFLRPTVLHAVSMKLRDQYWYSVNLCKVVNTLVTN